jgi:hypothetical protein
LFDDGPDGDPDHDSVTNAQERVASTHPRGLHTRYFAEGVTNSFFQTRLALFNPASAPAIVWLRLLRDDGTTVTQAVNMPARTGRTVLASGVSGLAGGSFSTLIESDVAIVADRTVRDTVCDSASTTTTAATYAPCRTEPLGRPTRFPRLIDFVASRIRRTTPNHSIRMIPVENQFELLRRIPAYRGRSIATTGDCSKLRFVAERLFKNPREPSLPLGHPPSVVFAHGAFLVAKKIRDVGDWRAPLEQDARECVAEAMRGGGLVAYIGEREHLGQMPPPEIDRRI